MIAIGILALLTGQVDVDSDLYVSAKECLEWMLRNRLMVAGTLLRYDDWKGHISWGETRAHLEMTIKYGLTWNNITIQLLFWD